MPYIPHTESDVSEMLKVIGASSIEELFSEIPLGIQVASISDIPDAMNELQLSKHMQTKVSEDYVPLNFIGAGCYEHYVPAIISDLLSRGEFLTAYTPYQAEASQGTLQILYEYQTMIANLLGMEVSNASLYEGGSALAEAILMAIRCSKNKANKILIPKTVNPKYRDVVKTITASQNIEIVELDYEPEVGKTILPKQQDFDALVLPMPNFFGCLEDVNALTDWAHSNQALVIAQVNPLAVSILIPPGKWGQKGADIVCGEAQPLGVALSLGGPYVGFLCCKKQHIRQLPGRLVGRTRDSQGKTGYTLTLQAREQHIRRSKATSNICTNQGLLAVAVTIYLSLMGSKGLQNVALKSYQNTAYLKQQAISHGINIKFNNAHFHEIVLETPYRANDKIEIGYDLGNEYPELKNCLLCCVTETKTKKDIDKLIEVLAC